MKSGRLFVRGLALACVILSSVAASPVAASSAVTAEDVVLKWNAIAVTTAARTQSPFAQARTAGHHAACRVRGCQRDHR